MNTISIVKSNKVEYAVNKAIELLGGIKKYISKGNKVILKPNIFTASHSNTGETTDPRIVEVLIDLVKKEKAIPIIAEGPGAWEENFDYIMKKTGYSELAKRKNVQLINLNKDKKILVNIPNGKAIKQIGIAKTILDADVIINIPKMKTHVATLVTLSLKNMKGCLVGREKFKTHKTYLDQAIVDINTVLKQDLIIVDGIVALEGDGPGKGGIKKQMDLIIAGTDPVAVDSVCSVIMGFEPKEIPHIFFAYKQNLGEISLKNMNIKGEKIENVKTKFRKPTYIPQKGLFYHVAYNKLAFFFLYDLNFRDVIKKIKGLIIKPKKAYILQEKCKRCGICMKPCPYGAIKKINGKYVVDPKLCKLCYICIEACPYNSIKIK